MQRPVLVTTVAVLESIAAVAFVLVLVDLIKGAKAVGEIHGFITVAAVVLGVMAGAVIFSCLGLWKGKRWGWWLALLMDLIGAAMFLWDPIERRVWPDVDELIFIVLFVVLLGLLLLPSVRRFLFDRKEALVETSKES